MTPHDSSLFWRTLGLCLVVLGLVAGIVVATDEAYSTVGMRLARLCAFCPLIGGVATLASLSLAKRRGESRALAALGVSPWRAGWGAICAAWLFGGTAAMLLLTPWVDVSSLFPEPPLASGWLLQPDAFLEPARGIRVASDGTLRYVPKHALTATFVTPGGIEAMSTILPQALVLPPWLIAPMRLTSRVWSVLLTLTLTLMALHAAALGRVSQLLLPLVAAPLGMQLALALERSRAQLTVFSAMLLGRAPERRH